MTVLVAVATLALTLTVSFANASFARSLGWGVLWGLFYCYWIVAPAFLESHHLHINGFQTLLVLVAVFGLAGGVFGVVLTAASLLPWGLFTLWSGRRPAFMGVAVVPAGLLPLAYVSVAASIEYTQFGRFVSVERLEGQVQIGVAVLVFCGLSMLARLNLAAKSGFPSRFRKLTVAALVLGVACLPLRDGRRPPAHSRPHPLIKRAGTSLTPLVIIAIDGVGWNIAEPLLKQGQLPWFQSVLVRGQRGSVTARWPPHWSGPAWAAIATGFDREQTGVIEDLHATAPGLPDFQLPLELDLRLNPLFVIEMELLARGVMTALPMPRMQLRRSPLWERVAAAGGRVGVVRFPFSYPATDESITNLSSLLALDFWDFAVFGGVDRNKLVTPARHAAAIKDVFARSSLESHRVLQQILPNPSWVNSPRDVNRIWVLDRLVDINEKTFDAADQVLATSDPFDLFVLYIPGTDTVSHAFWKYRFPEFFPANPPHVENVATLGPVIDRFLQHVDQRLGLILEKMPGANVLVVADHGQFATQSDPIWSGWHAGDGIFAAAGSEVPPSSVMRIVDYQDVVPFALDLMGFEIPEDLPKRSKSLRSVPRGN